MTKASLRVGIVGAGKIATDVHIPVLKAMPDVHIDWIADSDVRRSGSVARAFGLKQAPSVPENLPEADVVLLAIPVPPRTAYIDWLAGTNAAVFIEKPLSIFASDHARIVTQFTPWRLSVGYQRRTYATSRFLKRVIAEDTFGHLRRIKISEGARTTNGGNYWAYQDASVSAGGGITLNLGCHSLDLAQWIYGATRFELSSRCIEWDGETDRRASAKIKLFRSADDPGCTVDWTVSWLDSQSNRIELEFDRQTLSVPITPSRTVEIRDQKGRCVGSLDIGPGIGADDTDQSFYLEWQAVLKGVRQRKACDLAAATSLLTAHIMDDILAL